MKSVVDFVYMLRAKEFFFARHPPVCQFQSFKRNLGIRYIERITMQNCNLV